MSKLAKKLLAIIAVFFCISFVVIMINQTAQVVGLANTISPAFGQAVLFGLIFFYAVIILTPLILIIKLPKPIMPPDSESSADFEVYLRQIGKRLASNPHLRETKMQFQDRSEIEAGLKILDAKAKEIIKSTASTVFVTTAISQNGRLDALMVLFSQSRMIWQVAKVYNQRPALQELYYLYINVFATALIVNEIDDLDLIDEQIEPVITTVVGSYLANMVPVASVATILTNSIIEGSANAFLTLRVGAVTKNYCASLTSYNKRTLRRFASVEAAAMLTPVMNKSAKIVSKAIYNAAKKAGVGTLEASGKKAREYSQDVAASVSSGLRSTIKKMTFRA